MSTLGFALVEAEHVLVGPGGRLAGFIDEGGRIDRILRQVGAEPEEGNDRPLPVGCSVGADVFREDVPAVHEPAEPLASLRQVIDRIAANGVDRGDGGRIEIGRIEGLPRLEAERPHAEQDWIVVGVRRIFYEQRGKARQHCSPIKASHLLLRRRLAVDGRVGRHVLWRRVVPAPVRQRRELVAVLHLVDVGVVSRAIGLRAPQEPEHRGRRHDLVDALRQGSAPVASHEGEAASPGSGGALADDREHIRPHVEHLEQVVAPAGVGHREHHRLARDVDPGQRVERVEVEAHDILLIGFGIGPRMRELVDRRAHRNGRGVRHVGRLPHGDIHENDREGVVVGVPGQHPNLIRRELLLGPRRGRQQHRRGYKEQ